MEMLSYIALSSPVSTIWPLSTTKPSDSSGLANTLPSDMMMYLDGQPIIQSIFQDIPISSCSTVHQIQTAPCYDVFTLTPSRCTTTESTVAAVAVVLTQCMTTTDIVTRPKIWNSQLSRGGSAGVGRISAQLLTYVTGKPIYAQITLTSADLPLSEARFGVFD